MEKGNKIFIVGVLMVLVLLVIFFVGFGDKEKIEKKNDIVSNDGCYLGMSLPAEFQFFSVLSPWNAKISEDAKVFDNSNEMISALRKQLSSDSLSVNYNKWTTPIHVIFSNKCDLVSVTANRESGFFSSVDIDGNNVVMLPIPNEAWPDPENDAHLVLVDPYKKVSWEFSFFERRSDGIYASRIAVWDLNGDGYAEPFYGGDEGPYYRFGANAAGVPFVGGLIRPEEMVAGKIEHALIGTLPTTRKDVICSPFAQHTDGQFDGEDGIPEGARIQLNPNLNLDVLGLTKETKVIAQALQDYGLIVRDSGKGFAVDAQNLGSDGGAWKSYEGKINLDKIPLEEFRVLGCDLYKYENGNAARV